MSVTAPARPDVVALAAELHAARLERRTLTPLSERPGGLDEATAYAVQAEGMRLRRLAGERVIGGKLGFTSRAMRKAMGVAASNYGWLTDAMCVPVSGGWGCVDLSSLIHAKVELELGFVLGEDLTGPGLTGEDVRDATRGWVPVLELVDSRYTDFRFAAVDNVADNSSAARIVVGPEVPPTAADPRLMGCVLSVDGAVVDTACGAAVDPDPASAVAWMINASRATLPAGSLVISGSMTRPVDLAFGVDVVGELDHVGRVGLHALDADHPQSREDRAVRTEP